MATASEGQGRTTFKSNDRNSGSRENSFMKGRGLSGRTYQRGELKEAQSVGDRKRRWEEAEGADANDGNVTSEPKSRKKKRGGKSAREKELKWKIAQGLVDPAQQAPIETASNITTTNDDTQSYPGSFNDSGKGANTIVRPDLPKVNKSKTAGLPAWIAKPLTISSSISETLESDISNREWNLSNHLISRLREKRITHLFPVQMAVLPHLLQTRHSSAYIPPGDLCVSAPTGSGKTLAYALPIVESLLGRVIPRIRALIVIPTRDLAMQVKSTFDMLLRGTDIRCLLITGQTPFISEQNQLVSTDSWEIQTEEFGSSRIDILIATPGRLMDHLKGTKGFTLRHLRFLVLDEADRLLNQSYQDWLNHVFHATADHPEELTLERDAQCAGVDVPGAEWTGMGIPVDPLGLPKHHARTYRRYQLSDSKESSAGIGATSSVSHYTPLQKLLFSATLTRNPAKIAALHLYDPVYVAVAASGTEEGRLVHAGDARYVAPSTMEERMIVCSTAGDKPLMLLHLLCNLKLTGVLVFTKSVEAAHRLAALVQLFASSARTGVDDNSDENDTRLSTSERAAIFAEAFSSDLSPATRQQLLISFRNSTLPALICSDVMARGMDLGSSVHYVINYDIPTRVKTYVHRIGRTARAGRSGVAWSIVENKEVRWFKAEIGKVERAGEGKVVRVDVREAEIQGLVDGYRTALKELGGLVKGRGTREPSTDSLAKKLDTVDVESESDSSSSESTSDASVSDSDSASESEKGDLSMEAECADQMSEADDSIMTIVDRPPHIPEMDVDIDRLDDALKRAAEALRPSIDSSGRYW